MLLHRSEIKLNNRSISGGGWVSKQGGLHWFHRSTYRNTPMEKGIKFENFIDISMEREVKFENLKGLSVERAVQF